ncbi:MAG TPA: thiamine-phosphate kinase [Candidatus Acidoferrum sp.]|nr:thiamine-phosphate kinase [Candidatus Acidoferrum sp.]
MAKTKQKSGGGFGLGGEAELLDRIQRIAASAKALRPQLRVGIGDDAAVLRPIAGSELVLTCDWFLEGVHFLLEKHPPDAVGWKCLARAVSDVAAMGGVPRYFLLSIALPLRQTRDWLTPFLGGLRRASKKLGCALIGGDTTRSHKILICITVAGEVRTARAILRSGARPGDVLFVSGRLGEAELGLSAIRRAKHPLSNSPPFLRKHLYPEPRLTLGRWLAENHLPSAMMDLSDGLSTDLPRLCAASGVGARIESPKLPVVKVPRTTRHRSRSPQDLALHGGDDYELLFAVPPQKQQRVPQSYEGVPITCIGQLTAQRKILLVDESGRSQPLSNRGWDPFR